MIVRLIVYMTQLAMIANCCITDDCSCVSKFKECTIFEKVQFLLHNGIQILLINCDTVWVINVIKDLKNESKIDYIFGPIGNDSK